MGSLQMAAGTRAARIETAMPLNIFGESCPVAMALVRIAEAGHITDERIVNGGKPAWRTLMISRLSSARKIDRFFGCSCKERGSSASMILAVKPVHGSC
jgi:hypothetical protein